MPARLLKLAMAFAESKVGRVQRVGTAGIASGNGEDDAGIHGGLDRSQEIGVRGSAADAQVDDAGAVGDREVDGVGNVGVCKAAKRQARANAVGADRKDLRVEGDAVGADAVALGRRDARDLGAVAVDVVEERRVAGDDIGRGGSDVGVKVGVIHVDPGVDYRDRLPGPGEAAAVGAQDIDAAKPEVGLELGGVEIGRCRAAAAAATATSSGQHGTKENGHQGHRRRVSAGRKPHVALTTADSCMQILGARRG